MFDDVVYLDNAASTRLDERVLEAMRSYFFEIYAVATSEFGYSMGIEAKEALEGGRETIASALGGQQRRLYSPLGTPSRAIWHSREWRWHLARRRGNTSSSPTSPPPPS